MRISDWSSDVCSSDLFDRHVADQRLVDRVAKAKAADRKLDHFAIHICTIAHRNELVSTRPHGSPRFALLPPRTLASGLAALGRGAVVYPPCGEAVGRGTAPVERGERSEEHTSELQSLMRISYAGF